MTLSTAPWRRKTGHAGGSPRTGESEACVDAVRFKCDVLWAQLDALYLAYVVGMIPAGAYRPEGV